MRTNGYPAKQNIILVTQQFVPMLVLCEIVSRAVNLVVREILSKIYIFLTILKHVAKRIVQKFHCIVFVFSDHTVD